MKFAFAAATIAVAATAGLASVPAAADSYEQGRVQRGWNGSERGPGHNSNNTGRGNSDGFSNRVGGSHTSNGDNGGRNDGDSSWRHYREGHRFDRVRFWRRDDDAPVYYIPPRRHWWGRWW